MNRNEDDIVALVTEPVAVELEVVHINSMSRLNPEKSKEADEEMKLADKACVNF